MPEAQPRDPIPTAPPFPPALVPAAVFISGAAGLADELGWMRLLTLSIGATAPALSALLAAFFAGLALGSAAGARARAAGSAAMRRYAWIEFGLAAAAAASPAVLPAWGALASARPVAASLILLIPTFGMGLTLPLLCRALSAGAAQASRLYICNTLGGACGAAAAGFFLMEWAGLRGTLMIAAAMHVAAGALAAAAARGARAHAAVADDAPPESAPVDRGYLAAAAVAGAVSILCEVVLSRMLYQVLGGSTYVITGALVLFLIAIAAGSAFANGRVLRSVPPRAALGSALAVLSAAAAGSYWILIGMREALIARADAAMTLAEGFVSSAVVLVAVLGPVALASGFAFPVLVAAARGDGARSLGAVYAANTAGSIAASLAGTFLLVPAVGMPGALSIAAVVAATASIAAFSEKKHRAAAAAVLLAAGAAASVPARSERVRLWLYDALARRQASQGSAAARGAIDSEKTIIHVEGSSATATVYELQVPGSAPIRDFAINGKKEASTGREAQRNQLVLGHLPMLLHPSPKRALVVGLGAGVTAGAVSVHAGADVTIAELSPEVAQATRAFADANHGVLDRKNVHVVFADGRSVLAARRDAAFDVITSDPIHPWVAGAANLYTVDYFRLVRGALAPGGVAVHWLPLYELGVAETQGILAGFHDAFPSAALWITQAGDAVLVGSEAPLRVDLRSFAARARAAEVAADLKSVHLDDPLRLLAGLIGRPAGAAAPRFTDDRNMLEFRAARNLFEPSTVAANLRCYSDGAWSAQDVEAFLGCGSSARARLADLIQANAAAMRARAAYEAGAAEAVDAAIDAFLAEPDQEAQSLLLTPAGAEARLGRPSTAPEIVMAASDEARRVRRGASRDPEAPLRLRALVDVLRAARTAPGYDARCERAIVRQSAVLLGEVREYDQSLAVLAPSIADADADPTLLRIAARVYAKLGRDADADIALARADRADLRGVQR